MIIYTYILLIKYVFKRGTDINLLLKLIWVEQLSKKIRLVRRIRLSAVISTRRTSCILQRLHVRPRHFSCCSAVSWARNEESGTVNVYVRNQPGVRAQHLIKLSSVITVHSHLCAMCSQDVSVCPLCDWFPFSFPCLLSWIYTFYEMHEILSPNQY